MTLEDSTILENNKMDLNRFEVAIIIGTRAELIKTFPLMLELQKAKKRYYFIHTGQHSLGDLCRKFGVKLPDAILNSEPKTSSRFNSKKGKAIFWNVSLLWKIRKELKRLPNLKYVVYHGDTMTTASAAIASSKLLNIFKKYKNVHLEAGLRSANWREPFPEEISRVIAGRFSDVLFAVSKRAQNNLKHFKNKEVILTGNTVVDSAEIAHKIALNKKVKPLSNERFALISIHRHENITSKKRMKKIVDILLSVEMPAYFTLHDNTHKKLEEFGLYDKLSLNKNIQIIKPMDYPEFIYQISKCSLIICDGGSLQEESLIFEKPCIILRKATERQEGLESNFQFLSKLDVEKTIEKVREFSSTKFKVREFNNPYGRAGLSKKIAERLR